MKLLFVLRFCMQIVMVDVLPSQTQRPQNNLSLMCISKQKTLFKTMKFQICLLIFFSAYVFFKVFCCYKKQKSDISTST